MKDKQLLSQLNKLKDHRPSLLWLQSNRELLASQLYSGQTEPAALSWSVKANLLGRLIFQPQYVAVMIMLFFAGSGLFGYKISQASVPGDSLYIAKRISERAQLMLAFSDESKAKLSVEFAGKRLEELKDLIKDESSSDNAEAAKIADLKASVESEIKVARERLAKTKSEPVAPVTKTKADDSQEFIAAEATKDNQGLDISLPELPELSTRSADMIIEEASLLLDQDQLDKVKDRLDELNKLIR
jgi:hypothetical protein